MDSSRVSRISLGFFSFFLFTGVAMWGQPNFFEQVQEEHVGGAGCLKESQTELKVSCTDTWAISSASGYDDGVADNNYGTMKAYASASVTLSEANGSGWDSSSVTEIVEDALSVVGLDGEPIAFLNLEVECVECAKYANSAVASYEFDAGNTGNGTAASCLIPNPANRSLCTWETQLVYNINSGQTFPVNLSRQLSIEAKTEITNGQAGKSETTTTCIGYPAGGCGTAGATVKASVIDANGEVIKGAKVVGASGHVYN
jgi:hypothetical protein